MTIRSAPTAVSCACSRTSHRTFGLPLGRARYSIGETDATTALRRHIRSVTIMGMDENGLPAFSHTLDDVPENVNGDQVADIVEMVTELIRQS
jgi:hypothetical protein